MKPILFNTPMTRAIELGQKTTTRRDPFHIPPEYRFRGMYWIEQPKMKRLCAVFHEEETGLDINVPARFAPGDVLWVRETWAEWTGGYTHKANLSPTYPHSFVDRWHPSIHMPRDAARLFLRVRAFHMEPLQKSFSAQGSVIFTIRDEGIDIGEQCRQCIENYGYPCCNTLNPDLEPDEASGEDENGGSECGTLDEVRSEFARLWDGTVSRDEMTYRNNPYVWIYDFKQISKEEALRI